MEVGHGERQHRAQAQAGQQRQHQYAQAAMAVRPAVEEGDHRGSGAHHQCQHADRSEIAEPGEHGQHRVRAGHREADHDHRAQCGLQQRGDVRALVLGVRAAQDCRQQALAAHGIEIARRGVVEGDQARVDADDEHGAQHQGELRPAVLVGEQVEEVRRILQRRDGRHDFFAARTDHEAPQRERVEAAHQQQRRIRGDRNAAPWILGLFAVDGGRLEADEGGEAEQQADEGIAAGDGLRRVGPQVDAVGAAMREDQHVQAQHHDILGHHEAREHLRGEVDLVVTEIGHRGHRRQRARPPRQLPPGQRMDRLGGHRPQQAVQAELQHDVAEDGHHRHRPARVAAQAARHHRVEAARAGDAGGHGGVARREHEQQRQRHQHQGGRSRAVAQHDADRESPGHHAQRAGGRDHEQRDDSSAERRSPQARGRRRTGVLRSGHMGICPFHTFVSVLGVSCRGPATARRAQTRPGPKQAQSKNGQPVRDSPDRQAGSAGRCAARLPGCRACPEAGRKGARRCSLPMAERVPALGEKSLRERSARQPARVGAARLRRQLAEQPLVLRGEVAQMEEPPGRGGVADGQLRRSGGHQFAAHAVEAHRAQIVQRGGFRHRAEAVLHRAAAHVKALAQVHDAGHVDRVGHREPMALFHDETVRGTPVALGAVAGGIGDEPQHFFEHGLLECLRRLPLQRHARIAGGHGPREDREQPAARLLEPLLRHLDHRLPQQHADLLLPRRVREGLVEKRLLERDGQQVHAHGHVEHEFLATPQHEDALVIRLAALHADGAGNGDGHGEAQLAAGCLAMLHHALVDVLAKDMAARTVQLDERALQRPRRDLAVGLVPFAHCRCMHMDILKPIDRLIHGPAEPPARARPAGAGLSALPHCKNCASVNSHIQPGKPAIRTLPVRHALPHRPSTVHSPRQ